MIIEESKTATSMEEDAPFVEELTEDEYMHEMMKNQEEKSPETGEEELPAIDAKQAMLTKIMRELDGHENMGKSGYINGKYQYSYSEYKAGLKACSDLVIGQEAKEDSVLKAKYLVRRRKFCINAAAACIKIGHYQQGLEACTLVLGEGADTNMQRQKALFRAGVCARGMGELDAAKDFLMKLLDDDEVDERTQRPIKVQLKGILDEKKRYKKFAREMCSPTSEKNVESIILPKKEELTSEELEEITKVEEKREAYLKDKMKQKELDEKSAQSTQVSFMKPPEIMISEEDCISALDTLVERYTNAEVQKALKEATLDHNLNFSKGFIFRSKKILAPLQVDIFEKYGFLNKDTSDETVANTKSHDEALKKFQNTVRYLGNSSKSITEKADLCQRLAVGDAMMGDD